MAKEKHPIYVCSIKRAWLLRVIRLTGALDAVVEYDARSVGFGLDPPRATIRVDGVEVGVSRHWGTGERLRLLFRLPRGGGASEVQVELSQDGLIHIRYFRLVVAGETLYEEAAGKALLIRTPPPLPIPARAPMAEASDLPMPASEALPRADAKARTASESAKRKR
jgi:hypothetical protein